MHFTFDNVFMASLYTCCTVILPPDIVHKILDVFLINNGITMGLVLNLGM